MATVLKPPAPLRFDASTRSVFLAGSIEQGAAEDWQSRFERSLGDLNCTILNPRRGAWDASWEQSLSNPLFVEQVEWELAAQEKADVIAMYFAPATKAPITLLELGLFRQKKMIVCCPDGYWRKGNVDIVCRRYKIEQARDLDELIAKTRQSMASL